ncbi:MAG: mandelate racemase/muconate lactonizing enzyme family protein [Planctomycetales bacterium]
MKLTSYDLHRVHLAPPRLIGDSQACSAPSGDRSGIAHRPGFSGVGFDLQQGTPTPPLAHLKKQFEAGAWKTLKEGTPWGLALKLTRPRGGNVGGGYLTLPVETALWDLLAKEQQVPLYRLLGGTNPRVPAYGSTLDFHLTDEDFRKRLHEFKEMGFRAVKTKVGHPSLEWDLRRLQIVHEIFGKDVTLMVDANEAWSPKEALARIHAYREAGIRLFWLEDPIDRNDFTGLRRLCEEAGDTRINTGEYLGFSGKRQLLEQHAVDVLNIHGSISMSRAAAHLAGDYGIPVSLGNTLLEIGVHLAASLPECLFLEYSDLSWNRLAENPVEFKEGYAIAPDRPGHGLTLNLAVLADCSRAD